MPDLSRPRRLGRHTLGTALDVLLASGIPAERVAIRSAGPGWPPQLVLRQEPPPGLAVRPWTRIVLTIGGGGWIDAIPFPLRDQADDEIGTASLLELLDAPFLRLRHHLSRGGAASGRASSDERWLERIFHIDLHAWPSALRGSLATLARELHVAGGRADGLRRGFDLIFGLPIRTLSSRVGIVPFAGARSRLGARGSRLGVDLLLGEGLRERVVLEVTYGPLDTASYLRHQAEPRRMQRRALHHLLAPAGFGEIRERWEVEARSGGCRIGGDAGILLGVDGRLGSPAGGRS